MWSILAGEGKCGKDDPDAAYTICFSILPHHRPEELKSKFQSRITRFILGKKGHRFSKYVLFCLKTQGGLGFPNLWWYYQLAQLAQISSVIWWRICRRDHLSQRGTPAILKILGLRHLSAAITLFNVKVLTYNSGEAVRKWLMAYGAIVHI